VNAFFAGTEGLETDEARAAFAESQLKDYAFLYAEGKDKNVSLEVFLLPK
jgi:hypothetical protein